MAEDGTDPSVLRFAGTTRFEVLSFLGRGGMGEVYAALDREHGSRVALKRLPDADPDALLRFKNEFRTLTDLRHPNLIALGELIIDPRHCFFTMELIDGVDLLAYLRPEVSPLADTSSRHDTMRDTRRLGPGTPAPAAPPAHAGGKVDEALLRPALRQLAEGLHALHQAGKVHRDIKPSNVLVAPDGRVVILDFGLATDLIRAPLAAPALNAGTPAYMAPEQASGAPSTPAADWYSVGVLLYQALTGRLPFDGTSADMLAQKQGGEPLPPILVEPSVPPDLDRLCMELLRRDPAARLAGRGVLQRLADEVEQAPAQPTVAYEASFIGRRGELDTLLAAVAASRSGAVTVALEGESGIGKSALVHELIRRLAEPGAALPGPGAVVLAGRCFEREQVPYKGVDGTIDALSQFLAALDPLEQWSLLPRRAALLGQLFPVLRRVQAVAEAPADHAVADPRELRAQAFVALRELLIRVAATRPVVMAIDDLQWTDADSLALLGDLVRDPDAPRLLLVVSMRPPGEAPATHGALLEQFLHGVAAQRLELAPLEAADAAALAGLALQRAPELSVHSAPAIARAAGGHPLYILELAQSAGPRAEPLGIGKTDLQRVLGERIDRLAPDERGALELCCVAAGPMTAGILARAAGADFASFDRLTARLKVGRLLRATTGAQGGALIEPYHDHVRSAVLAGLEATRRRGLHGKLARVLEETPSPDPEVLMLHLVGAESLEQAGKYATLAAQRAERALAFDRAAALYEAALEWLPAGHDDAIGARVRLGDALANAGRSGQAGHQYLAAADLAPDATAMDLERRASEQFLRGGYHDEGLQVLVRLTKKVGLRLQPTPLRTLLALLYQRARLRLRGVGFKERATAEVPAAALLRVDICWAAAMGFSMNDTIRGTYFQTLGLLLALRAGEPTRVVRALAMETAFRSSFGGAGTTARHAPLLALVQRLAERTENPYCIALALGTVSICAFLEGRFKEVAAAALPSLRMFREQCTDVGWEVANGALFELWALYYLGEIGELVRRVPRLLQEAIDRGDQYTATNLRLGLTNVVWLAQNDVQQARHETRQAMGEWSRQGFHLQHYYDLLARVQIDLYTGGPRRGWERLHQQWPALRHSQLLRLQAVRLEAIGLRARCAVATALGAAGDRRPLRAAERDARRMAREDVAWAAPLAALIRAAVAAQRGQRERAVEILAEAEAQLEAEGLRLHAMAARLQRGELVGGESGAALVATATAWMEGQRIKAPKRMAALLAPGFR